MTGVASRSFLANTEMLRGILARGRSPGPSVGGRRDGNKFGLMLAGFGAEMSREENAQLFVVLLRIGLLHLISTSPCKSKAFLITEPATTRHGSAHVTEQPQNTTGTPCSADDLMAVMMLRTILFYTVKTESRGPGGRNRLVSGISDTEDAVNEGGKVGVL